MSKLEKLGCLFVYILINTLNTKPTTIESTVILTRYNHRSLSRLLRKMPFMLGMTHVHAAGVTFLRFLAALLHQRLRRFGPAGARN